MDRESIVMEKKLSSVFNQNIRLKPSEPKSDLKMSVHVYVCCCVDPRLAQELLDQF